MSRPLVFSPEYEALVAKVGEEAARETYKERAARLKQQRADIQEMQEEA